MSFKAFFLSLTIVAILFFSAFGTTITAYADDGTSTPPTEPGTPTPGTDEAATPVVTETAPVTDEAVPPVVTEVAPEVAPEPILEQLPENTTVAVVNAEGEAQPLASQESADAILLSDPIWCPEGQSPTPGENGCTQSYSSFTELLTFLKANESADVYQQAGTIYVQQGAYLGGESVIDFNSYNFTNINQQDLTIHGGWDTVDNSVDIADTSQLTVPIVIGTSANPWAGSVTINNIVISNVNTQAGLTAYSQSDITLSNVTVTNSLIGADLNSGNDVTISDSNFDQNKKTGADIEAAGNVEISNSTFNKNGSSKNTGKGLEINSGGTVSLFAVEANNNQVFGANIKATGPVTVTNSFFSGNKSYTYNCKKTTISGGYGLQVISNDAITLDGVTATGNYFFGAHLEGLNVEVSNSSFNGNGSGSASNPAGKGLEIISTGEWVTLTNVHADNNQLFGTNIQATGDVTVNYSFFNGNKSYAYTCKGKTYYGYGLQVVTSGTGGIYIQGVSALSNNLFGAHLDGNRVYISGGYFNNNGSDSAQTLTGKGIEIISDSLVTIYDIEANNNQLFGANIQAVDDVSISKGYFNGNKVYTYSCKGKSSVAGGGYGLQVVTSGDITLADIHAVNNYTFGAHLDGAYVAIATGFFNENGSGSLKNPTGEGLQINSTKAVSLVDVEANNNQLFGASIQATGDVSISSGFFNGNKGYTYACNGKNYTGYGLQVISTSGDISLVNIAADNNYLFGAHLEGASTYVSYGSFSNNSTGDLSDHIGKGLEIISTGAFKIVDVYQVNANNNQVLGADIKADGYVSVNTSNFNHNQSYDEDTQTFYGYGLTVATKSNINVYMVQANFNNLWGGSLTGLDVWVEQSQFNNNVSDSVVFIDDTGLLVFSAGNVTLETVEAKENRLIGADIRAVGNIFINNSNFSDNRGITCVEEDENTCSIEDAVYHGYGLNAIAGGNVELNGVTADRNNLFGAHLEGITVSVSNSTFNNNGSGDKNNPTGRGLEVVSTGDVTLFNVSANNNELFGANIQANGAAVSISDSVFSGNVSYTSGKCKGNTANGYGLKVVTTNNINLDNVTASDNGLYGTTLEGSLVEVSNSTFNNNITSHGLIITADVVVVENVTATNNGVDGAKICANDVTVNNSLFENNGRYGLNVGAPIFEELANTYLNNGTDGLFYNDTCLTDNGTGTGNGNNHGNNHHRHGNRHGNHGNHHRNKR